MHIPKYYREEEKNKIIEFMQSNNFPAIVSHDGEKLLATHTPVEVIENQDGTLKILGHMSRANPQWKSFGEQEALLIFQGAHTYISPRWYNHVNVPTWNYMIVHAYGKIKILAGDDVHTLLTRLVHVHEPQTGYSLETLPEDFVRKEIKGVTGFEVHVTKLEAAYKLSQNRDDESYSNIVLELEKRSDSDSQKIAQEMKSRR
ncbi:MAG: FMN-binding negative transcriptional regulator [Chloroflexi bacterium OLB14]|nr:MAG: FMN-binding negative transcriptional regulator [Chloroflexi bacterium OLB14]